MRRYLLLLCLTPVLACTASWSSQVRYSSQPESPGLSRVTAVHHAVLANYFKSPRDTVLLRAARADSAASATAEPRVPFADPRLPGEWADTLKREVLAAYLDGASDRWLSVDALAAIAQSMGLVVATSEAGVRRGAHFQMSNPGFNADSTIAVVHVVHVCGSLCGSGGDLFLARRPGSAWRVWHYRQGWVS